MTELKEVIKPPFQNYDIVVYFGCGLFTLPFIHHYLIKPLGLRFPHFKFGVGAEFADAAVSTLSLLFSVYLLGHLVAYASSLMVEKTLDRCLGKISSSVIITHTTDSTRLPKALRAWIKQRFVIAFRRGRKLTSAARLLFLLPVSVGTLLAYWANYLGYFSTRIPKAIFDQIKLLCRSRGYGRVSLHTQWYKALEHDVTNNCPIATSRMYNYLVISGVFRSLSLIVIFCAWAELYFIIHQELHGHALVDGIFSDEQSKWSGLVNLAGLNGLFAFTVTAYVKFARRYVEEAMFAFVLVRENGVAPVSDGA